jgi:tetratricopeptide (TPR) repeat protein
MKYFRLLATITFILASFSCENSEESEAKLGYNALVKLAWEEFDRDFFERSAANFNRAITINSDSSAAHIGLGWVLLVTDNIDNAKKEFDLISAQADIDVQAALAFYFNTQKDFSESNAYINSVLTADNKWDLNISIKYNYKHLLLLKAENLFQLAQFESAYNALKEIDATINITDDLSSYEGQTSLADKIENVGAELQQL